MNSRLLTYVPDTGERDPEWLNLLPPHTILRTLENLKNALTLPTDYRELQIVLLLPLDVEDLRKLTSVPDCFKFWRVLIELPDESRETLHLAQTLTPRYFSVRGVCPEFMAEIILKMVSAPKEPRTTI